AVAAMNESARARIIRIGTPSVRRPAPRRHAAALEQSGERARDAVDGADVRDRGTARVRADRRLRRGAWRTDVERRVVDVEAQRLHRAAVRPDADVLAAVPR